jgi:hypothetical protein
MKYILFNLKIVHIRKVLYRKIVFYSNWCMLYYLDAYACVIYIILLVINIIPKLEDSEAV